MLDGRRPSQKRRSALWASRKLVDGRTAARDARKVLNDGRNQRGPHALDRVRDMTAAADLVFVTNIPTPYRTAFFNKLGEVCDERGIRFHVLYCARTEPRRSWLFNPDENAYSYEFLRGWSPTIGGVTFPINPGILGRLASLAPQVVVHAGSWNMPTNLLALTGNRPGGGRLFWSEGHSGAVIHAAGPIAAIRRRVLSGYDGFVIPNSASRDWIQAQLPQANRCHILPNTVDEEFYRRRGDDERPEARRALNLHINERVIVQVGYLEELKGALELAQAFADAPPELRKGARLVFVGGGTQSKDIGQIARSLSGVGTIQLTGDLPGRDVRRWLMAADIFALNTKRDRNPLTPVEASFASLPLLLSSFAGNVAELVEERVTGFVIPDPLVPTSQLQMFLRTSADEIRRMGVNARLNVDAHFTRRYAAETFLDGLSESLVSISPEQSSLQ